MAVENLVDDFWREALIANATGPQAQGKWDAFIHGLKDRVAHFPQDAQDEVFLRAATRNAECIAIARVSLDALREKLGVPAGGNQLADVPAATAASSRRGLIASIGILLLVGLVIAAQFVTIFIVQPIGAVPEGRTVIITRLTNMNFIDSADGICDRGMGGVSLLCRGAVAGRVLKQTTILARLPYSATLYGISTGGKTFNR